MADLDYVKVVGRFGLIVADGTDADPDPDTVWCDGGTVRLTPLNTYTKIAASATPWTAGNAVIECPIDSNGYIQWNGNDYVWMVDLGSDKVNPTIVSPNATHRVDFVSVTAGGTSVKFPTMNVRISADTATDPAHPATLMLPADGGVVDLTIVSPAPAAGGTPIVQGPAGNGIMALSVDSTNLVATMSDGSTLEAPVGAALSTGLDAAVSDAQDSASTATDAATTATSAKSDAETARDQAQAAAATATAPTDAMVANLAQDSDSQTAAALSAAYAARSDLVAQIADSNALTRLATVGGTDREGSQAAQRAAWTDAPGWAEEWANITSWVAAASAVTVSGGRLYGNSGSGQIRRGIPGITDLRGQVFRATLAFTKVDSAAQKWAVGLTTGTAADGSDIGGANLAAIGENNLSPFFARWVGTAFGGPSVWSGLSQQSGLALNTALPAGTYFIQIVSTAQECNISLVSPDWATVVANYGFAWSSVTAPVTGISIANFDTRGAAGNYFSGVVARAGRMVSGNPRGSAESTAHGYMGHNVPTSAAGSKTMFLTPKGYDSRIPLPWIFYCHGYNEQVTNLTPAGEPTQMGPAIKALLDAGFGVIASDFTGVSNWGDEAAVSRMLDNYQYLVANFSVGRIGMIGHSMGALVSLTTIARRLVPNIAAWYGIEPACNLAWLGASSGYASAVLAAYGVGSASSLPAASDPLQQPGWKFRSLPMRVVSSPADTSILKTQNADKLVALVTPYSSDVTTLAATGAHTDPSEFQPSDIVAFFQRTLVGGVPA